MNFLFILIGLSLLVSLHHSMAENWSNWLGPNYNGSSENNSISLPPEGKEFEIKWKISVGSGWSAPIIHQNSVYYHDRIGEAEIIHCLNFATGAEIWRHSYLSEYQDSFGMGNGPRSTPSIRNGLIVTHGAEGKVCGLDVTTGKPIWVRDLIKDFQSSKGFFGRCSSPLIVGDRVIFDVGGNTVGLVAFSLKSGKTLWSSKPYGNDYSSSLPFFVNGKSFSLSFMREGFLVMDINTGREEFFTQFRSPINASVNATSPLIIGNRVFLSSCYDLGAGLWQYLEDNKKEKPQFKKLWHKKGILDCHYSTPVALGEYIYGFHGRQERSPVIRCIRLVDGEIMWESPSMGAGNLIRVSDKILVLLESGELVILKTSSKSCDILFRQQILGSESRAHFSFADGFLFARDKRRLICLQLSKLE